MYLNYIKIYLISNLSKISLKLKWEKFLTNLSSTLSNLDKAISLKTPELLMLISQNKATYSFHKEKSPKLAKASQTKMHKSSTVPTNFWFLVVLILTLTCSYLLWEQTLSTILIQEARPQLLGEQLLSSTLPFHRLSKQCQQLMKDGEAGQTQK